MRLRLPESRVDTLMSGYHWYLLLGIVLSVLAFPFDGIGVITGGMALWLGACGGSLQTWRTERGLWMLSGLFLILSLATYTLLQAGAIIDLVQQRGAAPWWVVLDCAVGTGLLGLQTRFLLTVMILNRQIPIHN